MLCVMASIQNRLGSRNERPRSDVKGEFFDELNVIRTKHGSFAELMKDYKNMSLEEFVTASNALNNFVDRIQSLSPRPTIHFS